MGPIVGTAAIAALMEWRYAVYERWMDTPLSNRFADNAAANARRMAKDAGFTLPSYEYTLRLVRSQNTAGLFGPTTKRRDKVRMS